MKTYTMHKPKKTCGYLINHRIQEHTGALLPRGYSLIHSNNVSTLIFHLHTYPL